jgi:DNA-binding Lrp family transcriptional regulator
MNSCILIRVLPGKGAAVLEGVKKFPQVKRASLVLGRYDVVAFAEAESREELTTLSSNVNAIPETKSTETLIEA